MSLRVRTQITLTFGMLLLLLVGIATVAVVRTAQIGRMADDLNGRFIDKIRIAGDIVSLNQQLRQLDTFLFTADDLSREDVVRQAIKERQGAIDAQVVSFRHLADNDLEKRLLVNLQRWQIFYRALQREVLREPVEVRRFARLGADPRLATAFDEVLRQARGLGRVAEAEAREARDQVAQIASAAQRTVLVASTLAVLFAAAILAFLIKMVFRPLAQVTRSLIDLSEGRLDVSLAGRDRDDEIGDMVGALDVFRRNAIALSAAHEASQAAHRRADALARHDALTGLPNRRVLTTAIADAIARASLRQSSCAVLVLDLDRFKPVNDLLGHAAGDKVLCAIAARLGACVRLDETAARLGGDEFAVVLEFPQGSDAPLRIAKRLIAGLTEPIALDGRVVSVGTSVGVALWPSDGADAEALLHAADLAMLKAKRSAPGGVSFFEATMDTELRARADLEGRVRLAIERRNIEPFYQPLVELKRNRIVGFEVLARWRDGDVIRPPSDFIAIADEAGLMPALTDVMIEQACRDARNWPDDLTLAVNVTPAQIADLGLPRHLLDLLAREGLDPARLELEVTENALIGDIASAKAGMATLREHGVRFALDDFGTGYSSLHHLRHLKFDTIKIDRSFVQSMEHNAESAKIVETVLALGRSLGIHTLAEGIEEAADAQALLRQGCEFGQGFHFGRPVPAGSVAALLARATLPAAA